MHPEDITHTDPSESTEEPVYPERMDACTCNMAICRCAPYKVYYAGGSRWQLRPVDSKHICAEGSLEAMMHLVMGPTPLYQGCRASWAEDMLNNPAQIFFVSLWGPLQVSSLPQSGERRTEWVR